MNVSGLRRNIKNIAHNYTDAQVKVREATSNDPWGPSSSLMSEIADLTYNVVAFTEIMQMIWKRLNDHGKNWRHVYKALVLLDYLVKTGNEKVAQQCKENIFAIHTLKDFQHYEDGKDQGIHVREKSKQLAALLKDDERLKNERAKALKARERFAQQITGFGTGSDPSIAGFRSDSFGSEHERMAQAAPSADLDLARPQTAGEEELQLQLALAISREEAEKEEEKRRSDEVRLALAISQSQESGGSSKRTGEKPQQQQQQQSHLLDLLDVNVAGASGWVDPWGTPAHPSEPPAPVMPPRPKASAGFPSTGSQQQTVDPWGAPVPAASALQSDPWGSPAAAPRPAAAPSSSGLLSNDPWAPKAGPAAAVASTPDPWSPQPPVRTAASASADPWSPVAADQKQQSPSNGDLDDFDLLVNRKTTTSPFGRETNGASSPFDTSAMRNALEPSSSTGAIPKKSPENFLGANSNLVNLDNLVAHKPAPVPAANPFALTSGQPNPFQQAPAPKPSINELRHQQNFGFVGTPLQQQAVPAAPQQVWGGPVPLTTPMVGGMMMQPASGTATSPTFNPFMA